ncbi:hypothetical protein K449DRAFT_46969 [Hypoxylon sp. EC38]|nr:hypothetical protein K449DRAFT_46969 [Hypoxylon sp. EC38]
MDSPISKDNTGSGLSGVTVVVVTGLRESNSSREAREATPQPLFWESDGVLKAQIPAYNCINFSEGSSPILTDYLSPDFFDSKARNLLDFVLNTKRAEDGSNQLIFVGEDLGGIIVKKALSLAALDLTRYGGLMRDTCACVRLKTPILIASRG